MDIRAEFINFFKNKNHKEIPSSDLVPNDPTLLFTNAGMVPFKDIFTGISPIPNPPRAVSVQTCIRAGGKHNDLENVGFTARHHTFFEMLGNFSFGDYFKKEVIDYSWEFITQILKIDPKHLWVTVHQSDDEAYELWQKHIQKERIKKLGDKDNFWQMGDTGACGPCSEIFYDQGEENFNTDEDYLGGEGDRFLEIWNLVFMQYERSKDGVLTPLPKPSIDTGMGYERVVAILEGVQSNYSSSLFMPIINEISKIVDKKYNYQDGASFRVIADHIRSVVFLLAQGVRFSSEGRGYVLRRILRRAIRHGYKLGLREPFMFKLVGTLNNIMGTHYTYLTPKVNAIKEQIQLEEERFFQTIESGMKLFTDELNKTKDIFDGKIAFKLYDTYGFPIDLTEDMLKEANIKLDFKTFEQEMQKQKESSKQSWKGNADTPNEKIFKEIIQKFGYNTFVGYQNYKTTTTLLALLDDDFNIVKELDTNSTGWVLLKETPFYANSGGQIGDKGKLKVKNHVIANITDTLKFFDLNLSQIKSKEKIKQGTKISAILTKDRVQTAKHHSATHLLHFALQKVLGDHIEQAGSLVGSDKLRFDFSHPKAISDDELEQIEKLVNKDILDSVDSNTKIMDIKSAKKSGAKALFGEKYADEVRVVSIGAHSVELCGGTHVKNSSEIGMFIITKESGVSAGVRRIEAVCGKAAFKLFTHKRALLKDISELTKNKNQIQGIERLKAENAKLKEELKDALSYAKEELKVNTINNINVIIQEIKNGDVKQIVDEYKNKYDNLAIMLFSTKNDKVTIVAGSKNSPIKAGSWIKEIAPILGGGGGGRDDFAQAGGKDASKISEAIEKSIKFVENNTK